MLKDMGLDETSDLLKIEQADFLDAFKPPMVDTYALYGFGVKVCTHARCTVCMYDILVESTLLRGPIMLVIASFTIMHVCFGCGCG